MTITLLFVGCSSLNKSYNDKNDSHASRVISSLPSEDRLLTAEEVYAQYKRKPLSYEEKELLSVLDKYDIEKKPKRSAERFHLPLAHLAKILEMNNDIDELIDVLISSDTRNDLFRLQALIRIYKKQKNKNAQLFEQLMLKIKGLEDAIGKYSEKMAFLKFAKTIGADQSSVIPYIEKEAEHFKDSLKRELQNEWSQSGDRNDGVQSFIEIMSEVKWMKYKKDKKFVIKRIQNMIKKVSRTEYDMSALQEGIHEYRRQVRWTLLYVQSLQGLINFKQGAGSSTNDDLNSSLADLEKLNNKYLRFNTYESEKHPVKISFPYYMKLTDIVKNIGDLKDLGENFHYVIEAYVHSGKITDQHQAHAQVVALAKQKDILELDVTSRMTLIYNEINDLQLLQLIEAELD